MHPSPTVSLRTRGALEGLLVSDGALQPLGTPTSDTLEVWPYGNTSGEHIDGDLAQLGSLNLQTSKTTDPSGFEILGPCLEGDGRVWVGVRLRETTHKLHGTILRPCKHGHCKRCGVDCSQQVEACLGNRCAWQPPPESELGLSRATSSPPQGKGSSSSGQIQQQPHRLGQHDLRLPIVNMLGERSKNNTTSWATYGNAKLPEFAARSTPHRAVWGKFFFT